MNMKQQLDTLEQEHKAIQQDYTDRIDVQTRYTNRQKRIVEQAEDELTHLLAEKGKYAEHYETACAAIVEEIAVTEPSSPNDIEELYTTLTSVLTRIATLEANLTTAVDMNEELERRHDSLCDSLRYPDPT